ncbi:hypothetical protein ABEF95_003956 [Exophiala dermatitidis]
MMSDATTLMITLDDMIMMPGPHERPENNLTTLFERYPDITFDATTDLLDPECDREHFSSPCSNLTDHDEAHHSVESDSTANTTPLRPQPQRVQTAYMPDHSDFLVEVEGADLPEVCKHGFRTLAYHIAELTTLLVLLNGRLSSAYAKTNREAILAHSQDMLVQLRDANNMLAEHVRNDSYIKSLALFTIEPAQQDVWTIFRQRAQVIVDYTALPSASELKLSVHLAHLFDAYVYHPFIRLPDLSGIDLDIQARINDLYDGIMTLPHGYRRWCNAMKDIRHTYMLPLLRQMRESPVILQEIKDFEQAKSAALAVVGDPGAPGMRVIDETVIRYLEATASQRRRTVRPMRS